MPHFIFLKMDVKNIVFTLAMFFLFTFIEANHSFFNIIANRPPSPTPSSIVLPIQGTPGTYTVTLNIGNPSKPYALFIDTGSDLTWVKCEKPPSTNCNTPSQTLYETHNNILKCENAFCYKKNVPDNKCEKLSDQCEYLINYDDESSSSGVLVQDNIHLETSQKTLLVFGCGYDQEGNHKNYAGILGLTNVESSLLSQLYNLGLIRNVMGHCLRNERGFIFLGDLFNTESGIVWAPMSKCSSSGYYTLGPVDILFNGEETSAKNLQFDFDSGTTSTHIHRDAYKAVLELIINDLKETPLERSPEYEKDLKTICWKQSSEPFNSLNEVKHYFKPLTLRFSNNVQLQLPPENYLFDGIQGDVCLGLLDNGNDEDNIIGAIAFQNKLIVYDNERQRIGWKEGCPNNALN